MGLRKVESHKIPVLGESGRAHLIGRGAHGPLSDLCLEQLHQECFWIELGVPSLGGYLGEVGCHAMQLQSFE